MTVLRYRFWVLLCFWFLTVAHLSSFFSVAGPGNDAVGGKCAAADIFKKEEVVMVGLRCDSRCKVFMRFIDRFEVLEPLSDLALPGNVRVFLVSENEIIVFRNNDVELSVMILKYSKENEELKFEAKYPELIKGVEVKDLKELSSGPERTFYNGKCERLYGDADVGYCRKDCRSFYDFGARRMTRDCLDDSVHNVIKCNEFSTLNAGELQVQTGEDKCCYLFDKEKYYQLQVWNTAWNSLSECQSIDYKLTSPGPTNSTQITTSASTDESPATTVSIRPQATSPNIASPYSPVQKFTRAPVKEGHSSLCYSIMAFGFAMVLATSAIFVSICKGWIPGSYVKSNSKLKPAHDAVFG